MSAFISNEELIFYTQILFPDIEPGRHYTVICSLDATTKEPLVNARYKTWSYPEAQPTPAKLKAMRATYDYTAWQQADAQRLERARRLAKADVLVARAEDQGDEAGEAAARAYRQALRDVPQQKGFPQSVNWPEPPSALPGDYPKVKS